MSPTDATRLAEHARGLRRLARALVGDGQAADDLVQETYVVALSKGEAPSGGWLRGVLRNRARERRRAERRRLAREAKGAGPSPSPRPDETAAQIDEQRRVTEALARVPEPYRTAVWMRYFAGYSARRMSRQLGVPVATVRSRVHRGLEHLRADLDRRHGSRRSWQLLLLPLVPDRLPVGPGLIGGAAMAAKMNPLAACAIVLALVGAGALGVSAVATDTPSTAQSSDAALHADTGQRSQAAAPASDPSLEGRAPVAGGGVRSRPLRTSPPVGPEGSEGLRRVGGRVRVKEGALPNGVRVYAIGKDAEAGTRPAAESTTQEGGRFTLELEDPARYWIVARGSAHEGWLPAFADGGTWREGASLELVLRRAPERVFRVRVPEGHAQGPVRLVISPLDATRVRTWPRPGDEQLGMWTRSTDSSGVLRLRLPTSSAFRVRAKMQGLAGPERVVQPDETEIVLELVASARIRVRIEGWSEGDMPITGRLFRAADEQAHLVHGRSLLDGTVLFDQGVIPGTYRIRLHSPHHEETVVENVRVNAPGEELELTARVEPKASVGSLAVRVRDNADEPIPAKTPIHVFWRAHTERVLLWRNRGARLPEEGRFTLIGLEQGRHDLYLATAGRHGLAGVLRGGWVRAGEAEPHTVVMRQATMRRMPDLGDLEVRSRRLVHEELGELPLFFAASYGSQSYAGPSLPPAGRRIGPYPEGRIELEVEDGNGKRHAFVVESAGR